jgi:hypothetical protein
VYPICEIYYKNNPYQAVQNFLAEKMMIPRIMIKEFMLSDIKRLENFTSDRLSVAVLLTFPSATIRDQVASFAINLPKETKLQYNVPPKLRKDFRKLEIKAYQMRREGYKTKICFHDEVKSFKLKVMHKERKETIIYTRSN